jgi:hypothetical protein
MSNATARTVTATLLLALVSGAPAGAQLSGGWMIPAAANTGGVGGTEWHTDVNVHNPHGYELPVIVQLLPSDTANTEASTLALELPALATVNLWDALGPDLFDHRGTAALLATVDLPASSCDPVEACDFLITSRTYTLAPGGGEHGQGIPGAPVYAGVDWEWYGYAAGVLNGNGFRCNIGVASWTAQWTTVLVDVQDDAGTILATEQLDIPPFGHVQQRLATLVEGGSLVFYLAEGPNDALVFPYASVVNDATGDPTYVSVTASPVGELFAVHTSATSDNLQRTWARPRPTASSTRRIPVTDPVDRKARVGSGLSDATAP